MIIGGFQKFSMLDYPGKISSIVFTQGCNFNCVYCHNRDLLKRNCNAISLEKILDFLKERKGKIDAVVITGGEPTLQPKLIDFMKKIKKLDLLVKLDTNGSNPEVIRKALRAKVVDYIAMDIKAPFQKYNIIAGVVVNKDKLKESINIIKNSDIQYEFRTTVPESILSKKDVAEIKNIVPYNKIKIQKCNEEFIYAKAN